MTIIKLKFLLCEFIFLSRKTVSPLESAPTVCFVTALYTKPQNCTWLIRTVLTPLYYSCFAETNSGFQVLAGSCLTGSLTSGAQLPLNSCSSHRTSTDEALK